MVVILFFWKLLAVAFKQVFYLETITEVSEVYEVFSQDEGKEQVVSLGSQITADRQSHRTKQ